MLLYTPISHIVKTCSSEMNDLFAKNWTVPRKVVLEVEEYIEICM